jgi:hypothetical protein
MSAQCCGQPCPQAPGSRRQPDQVRPKSRSARLVQALIARAERQPAEARTIAYKTSLQALQRAWSFANHPICISCGRVGMNRRVTSSVPTILAEIHQQTEQGMALADVHNASSLIGSNNRVGAKNTGSVARP